MKKNKMGYAIILLLTLSLVGCGSLSPKKVIKKGSYYIRDKENDYHTSYLLPPLNIPEGLTPLDGYRAQITPTQAPVGRVDVNIEPPGIF